MRQELKGPRVNAVDVIPLEFRGGSGWAIEVREKGITVRGQVDDKELESAVMALDGSVIMLFVLRALARSVERSE